MVKFKNTAYHIIEGAVPRAICEEICTNFRELTPAEIHSPLGGSRHDISCRVSDVVFLEQPHWIAGILEHFIRTANERVWNYEINKLQVVQLTSYAQGGFFDWHKDTSDGESYITSRPEWDGLVRKLSATLILSDTSSYEGGGLEIRDEYGNIWRDPAFRDMGNVVVFPSNQIHRVDQVTTGNRKSAVAWMLGPPLR